LGEEKLMRFNYRSEFEDWCILHNYEPDELLNKETLLEKSYSKIIQFYIANDNGTYAQVKAYHSSGEGLFDISVEKEGLTRKVTQVMTEKVEYV
jgi:hypothetical protein